MDRQSQDYYAREEGTSEGSHLKQWQSPPSRSAYPPIDYPRPIESDRDAMGSSPEADGVGEAGRDDHGDGKKRRRIQQACKACSLRRVKCNGEKPCQTCLKNNDECVYGQPKKRGPAKGTTRSTTRKEQSESTSPHAMSKSSGNGSRRRMSSSNIPSQSPTSISASSHLQSVHAPPPSQAAAVPPPPEAPSYNTAASTGYPHYRRGSAIGSSTASAYDRQFPHHSSVYRGGSSGWDGGGFQGSFLKNQSTSIPPYHMSARPYDPEGRLDHYNGSGHSSQWPSRSSSQRNLPSPAAHDISLHTVASEPKNTSLFPLQGLPVIPPHQRTLRRRSLQLDELEVADEALSSIITGLPSKSSFREEENKESDEEESKRKRQKIGLQGTDITLDKPNINEEKKEQLFHVYWTVVSLYWPLFYRDASGDERQYRIQCEKEHPFLFNAICSTSALVLSESSNDKGSSIPSNELTFSQMSTVYYARARYYNIGASHSPCLESATALIVLSLREYGAGRSTEAGRYCWSACRMALDLGLHRCGELSQSSTRSFKEEETRKRVYWCAYVLDKTLAAQMGRPPILRSLESDCPLPTYSEEEDELTTWDQMKHNSYPGTTMTEFKGKRIGLSSYFINGCKLAVIAESIIAQYNIVRSKQDQRDQGNTVSQLHADLKKWMNDTPRHLSWTPLDREGHLPYILHQQIWSQICMILIHRPYILKGSGASHLNSHAECSKATELTCGMFEEHEQSFGFHSLPSGSVYCLFTAATIALANTTSKEVQTAATAKHQLQQCISWLRSLSRLWKSASDHVYILEKLACGIDPTLADEIITASDRDGKRRDRLKVGSRGRSDNEISSKDTDMSTYPSSNRIVKDIDECSISQAPSIEAFWNDMPLGEDFDRWASFTQSYFKSPNMDTIDTINEGSNKIQKSSTLADLMTPSEDMPPPRAYPYTTNPYLPIYGGSVNNSRP